MNENVGRQNLFFNGIDGDTGEYDLPPMTGDELFGFIQGENPPENLDELRYRYRQATAKHLGLREGLDPTKLEESGWGIIFAHDADPAIKEALTELIHLRRSQTGQKFRIYEGADGYRRGRDSKSKFLARHGAGPGPADPDKVPYYLLIVGSPEAIPYRFQSQLDVQYAVGRLHFDTLQEYANYAGSVKTAETGTVKLSRDVALFGVANEGDQATQLSAEQLVRPLSQKLESFAEGWTITTFMAEKAKKAQLLRLLGGDQTPALLFSASHGLSFSLGSPRQVAHQGAILCQDWPGPQLWTGPIVQDHYLAGDDLSSDANLLGQIAFLFACYGAGTPLNDEFSKQAFRDRTAIAPYPFLANLPTKMVGHPRGGALAVIGHVERAWGYSFMWPGAGSQTTVFESTLQRLLKGHPVGSAIEYFNSRYAELATVLSDELENIDAGKQVDPYELSGLWTANNDARGYAIIGDPAVRLPVAKPDEAGQERPVITVQQLDDQKQPTQTDKEKPTDIADTPSELETGEPASYQAEQADQRKKVSPLFASLLPELSANLKTINIKTFTSANIDDPAERKLLIETQLTLDGRGETVMSTTSGEADSELMALHQAIVKEAVAARLAYLQILAQIP